MNVRRHLLALAGLGALFVAFLTAAGELALPGLPEWGVAIATTIVGGLLLGRSQYLVDRASDDGERPIFEPGWANVAFWAVGYVGFFYALVLSAPAPNVDLPFPWWLVPVAVLLFGLVAVALGGLNRNVDPRYVLREYRKGKRLASSDE